MPVLVFVARTVTASAVDLEHIAKFEALQSVVDGLGWLSLGEFEFAISEHLKHLSRPDWRRCSHDKLDSIGQLETVDINGSAISVDDVGRFVGEI